VWQHLFALLFNVGKSTLFPKVQQALSYVYTPSSLAQDKKNNNNNTAINKMIFKC